jgi:hypothetical protein
MKRSSRPRKTFVNLSESISRQLDMYALAAGAAGVGLLALAQPSEGKIVYTATHHVIAPKHSYRLDLNHDGTTDFTLNNYGACGTDSCQFSLSLKPTNSNRAAGYVVSSFRIPVESALHRGDRVGPGDRFQKGRGEMVNVGYFFQTYVSGPWANVQSRYLGLKFKIKGETHYGWARLNVKVQKTVITATLSGYAYETIPNKAIVAGKETGTDDANLEQSDSATLTAPISPPASLGLLGMGAPGLSIWRRESVGVLQ